MALALFTFLITKTDVKRNIMKVITLITHRKILLNKLN